MQTLNIPVTYIDTAKYTVSIYQDWMFDNFAEYTDAFEVVQCRDNNYTNFVDLDNYTTETGKLLPSVQAKLRAGKMFTVSYSSYSSSDGGFYRLDGDIPTGAVDSRDVNGFIIFNDDYIKGVSYENRKQYAMNDLKIFTEWANGEVYTVTVETASGAEVDTCGGFIGDESVKSFIAETLPYAENENVTIQGKYTDGKTYDVYINYNDCKGV